MCSMKDESIQLPDGQVLTPASDPVVIERSLRKFCDGRWRINQADLDLLVGWLLEKPKYKYEDST